VLVELSVMEQRYEAVMAVIRDGWQVTEVARRLGVSRQSVHAWIARYEAGGLPALADRSHRPRSSSRYRMQEGRSEDRPFRSIRFASNPSQASNEISNVTMPVSGSMVLTSVPAAPA
jgi:transposase-like protein